MKTAALRASLGLWSRLRPQSAGEWLQEQFLTPRPWTKPHDTPTGTRHELPDGGVLWSDKEGERNAVLLHGWSGHRSQFDTISNRLRNVGFAVHLLDPPGHGASTPQRSNPVRFMTAAVEAALVAGPFDIAIGHSMGGAALMQVAVDGQHDVARRLVSISAPNGPRHPIYSAAGLAGFGARATDRFAKGVETEVGRPISNLDIASSAGTLRIPLLLVHDETDPQIPVHHARHIAARWPDAQFLKTHGYGHNRTLSAPETCEAIIGFAT